MDDLLRSAIDGDAAAEKEILRLLRDRFYLFAKHRLGDADAADDVAQEAVIIVSRKFRTQTYTVGFEAWAHGILRMRIRNYFDRQSGRRDKSAVTADGVLARIRPPLSVDPELEMQLGACLKKIVAVKPLYARVLNLVYQGYTTGEISSKLCISPNYLYVILNRARRMLRACLDTGEVDDG